MTSSDRQLLERAAKAVGMTIGKNRGEWMWWEFMDCFNRQDATSGASYMWNPLKSDADALRLAVKLNIQIAPDPANRMGCAWLADESDAEPIEETIAVELWRNSDEYAATRRAIVRAAASMGEHK